MNQKEFDSLFDKGFNFNMLDGLNNPDDVRLGFLVGLVMAEQTMFYSGRNQLKALYEEVKKVVLKENE